MNGLVEVLSVNCIGDVYLFGDRARGVYPSIYKNITSKTYGMVVRLLTERDGNGLVWKIGSASVHFHLNQTYSIDGSLVTERSLLAFMNNPASWGK